ncbi:MAG: phage holin family protein [Bacillota bacterium]
MAYHSNGQVGMPEWVIKWLINALALLIVSYVPYRGGTLLEIDGAGAALIAAMVLGIVNTFIRPIFMMFSLPLRILSLGLFTLVINALMLCMGSWLMGNAFNIPGFWAAILASVLLSLVSSALNHLIRGDSR